MRMMAVLVLVASSVTASSVGAVRSRLLAPAAAATSLLCFRSASTGARRGVVGPMRRPSGDTPCSSSIQRRPLATTARLGRRSAMMRTTSMALLAGQPGHLRTALTAAYAVGGMALALLFSSPEGGQGKVAAAQQQQPQPPPPSGKKREPRMVTGADPGTREFYPPIEPHRTGMLAVSPTHTLYWEESGNPSGKPVVFLHGGPGGGTSPDFRRYFDPAVYRIVVFDQRGCGKSTPHACLEENTTWDLVADIERLREHLGIERWAVFGGSWGSTLSLTYAIQHTDRVSELILRGIFMLRHKELQFYYQEGSSWIYPDAFEPYEGHIPLEERQDLIKAYHRRLTSEDEATRLAAAREWTRWEMATSRLLPDWASIRKADDAKYAEAFARIENHYFINKGWFSSDAWILENVHKIRHIPAVIVQGRYDSVCPTRSAFDLWRAWPESDLVIVQDAGHSAAEPGIRSELIKAADRFGKNGNGSGTAAA